MAFDRVIRKSYAMPAAVRQPVVVIAPDSFKGSLDAHAVCEAVARGLRRVWPDAAIRACPMADGGEGTLDAVLSRGGERRQREVTGAAGKPHVAAYGIVNSRDGATAVLEAAEVVGIMDPDGMSAPVTARATQGVGELIRVLLDAGIRRFMIGLGGSSTNDGGAGMLAALGLKLVDAAGRDVAPAPEGLASLAAVDAHGLDPRLAQASITIMSDVNNPLCGERGATAIFGPQKGVRAGDVATIDAVLARYAALVERATGVNAAQKPGAGAAGGLGFALQQVGGTFRSGAEVVANLIGLDAALADADWAITGEGRTDAQTLLRKAPFVVAERALAAHVPITLLSGAVDAAALPELGRVFAGCFALPSGPMTLADCIANADALLADRAEQIARLWTA
jgi:glycerate kinase